MSARHRFAWWVVVVAGCLAVMPLRLIESDAAWLIAAVVQSAGLAVMLVLLLSTPPGAIRLRPETSWTLIMSGTWVSLACATPTATPTMLVAAGVLAVLVPLGVWSMALGAGASAWWVVLVAWSPALPTLVARQLAGEPGWVIVWSWSMCVAGLIAGAGVVGVYSMREPEEIEEGGGLTMGWKPAALILGITTLLSGFVPMLS